MVVALVADVGLGARAWDTWSSAEMSLGLSVLGSSKKEGVGTFYNILSRIEERYTYQWVREARADQG